MSAHTEFIERFAAALFESDEVMTSWHNARTADADEYRAIAASEVSAYRDAILREAAQKIRNSDRLRDYTDDHMSDCNEAADEIDPDSYVNRCQGCGNSKNDGQVHGYGAEFGGCV
ncbi:hypothetical protein [Streptomyces sp. ITFR-6]|uniref:hypothetical protein n=1 Tax=Streptomyces sp. ITFR-6 TaxID=3075197 RepID=UPI0028898EC2|nr:hypothetical protein [Streptomyces sp. ITFR-6]WNI28638.1 hypothetical protein RLT59_07430 [Streptomyces sp. ITFR-6]